jgi:serine/threonine protein kinase
MASMQAQECCEGGSLADLLWRAAKSGAGKRLYNYGDALRWMSQTAKALQYLHESSPQVLHRDLKSDNLLLSERFRAGDIRVMDFGLTKLCSAILCTPAASAHVSGHCTAATHLWCCYAQAAGLAAPSAPA